MKKKIMQFIVFLVVVSSCKDKEKTEEYKKVKLDFNLEKVIVINVNEECLTYFKMKISNLSNQEVVLQDNNLMDALDKNFKTEKQGFYLKNNDKIIPLAIDKYYFFETGKMNSSYYFIGGRDLKFSYNIKDSLEFRKLLTNSVLEYNGKKFDLNKVKKSIYINNNYFERFIKNKDKYVAYIDSVSIKIPESIELKYLNKMPGLPEEWDKL